MKYLRLFEEFSNVPQGVDLIIKTGTELYHSSIETFDKKDLGIGGYDKILWTTEQSGISQFYIPYGGSGGSIYTSTSLITNIRRYNESKKLLESLGIFYKDVEINKDSYSFKEADIFKDFSDKCSKYNDKLYSLYLKLKEFEKKHKEIDSVYETDKITKEEFDKFYDDYNKIETEYDNLLKSKNDYNLTIYKNKYVNEKLIELGYTPKNKDFEENCSWKLKLDDDGKILPSNFKDKGRLFILSPKKDFKIFDTTFNETKEPDLTDLDYHKHSWFKYGMENGYDGIKICDFAQSEKHGNVAHFSISLFKNTITDLYVEEIDAYHPTDIFKDSEEYLNRKKPL